MFDSICIFLIRMKVTKPSHKPWQWWSCPDPGSRLNADFFMNSIWSRSGKGARPLTTPLMIMSEYCWKADFQWTALGQEPGRKLDCWLLQWFDNYCSHIRIPVAPGHQLQWWCIISPCLALPVLSQMLSSGMNCACPRASLVPAHQLFQCVNNNVAISSSWLSIPRRLLNSRCLVENPALPGHGLLQ